MSDKKRSIIKTSLLVGFATVIIYVLFTNLSDIKKSGEALSIGDDAPDFQLINLEGETVKLSDYRGQGVLLNFWATYCPPCKKEMPYMQNQYELFKEKGVTILAVNVAEPQPVVEKFVGEYGLTFPVLLDLNQETMDLYDVAAIPVSFLIDENGKVVDRLSASLTESQIADYMEQIMPEYEIDKTFINQ
ncbi:thiol-disulfide oxidoreductase ResA [Planococcus halotolerans]|uniref:thiol-disulfide oxidoreductase ResA n=1 Tax=Planococcus halotolerans TaxID=2233542 RepID=UPI001092EFB4|nr:thiol-disulfide oxidoreductase ResA [Planococcus halotolerans]QHJ70923.1 thiol-disulfide oxidoreductase ResA [Planococcus halotolerans]